ncbi:MarR family winged helix-turn-helix transcriptional regulator [Caulobacter sp. NIBR2454]|uniref:MarR family winged helix-turn-helix transcriptional regulator n=1 Tax=Caulobacter sp. NIBR2454 TaxID=3015996 RepID=UPI0022B6D40C|nr:MarR family winged helix-turn-helix transcriptional regulator [Caulobacter sp. NIBR2454]
MSKATAGDDEGVGLKLDGYLPFRLSIASNAVSRLIARAYEDRFGLTVPQWRLIAVLAEQPMTQQAIVVRTVMDKVMVSRAAHGLTTRRLVERSAHEADGRSHVLSLSDEGRRLYAEVAPLAQAYEAALLTGLTPKEVAQLKRLLLRLEAAAAKLSGEDRGAP